MGRKCDQRVKRSEAIKVFMGKGCGWVRAAVFWRKKGFGKDFFSSLTRVEGVRKVGPIRDYYDEGEDEDG